MSEERLKAIEKEINYRLKKERIITIDFGILCELYNEVIRLKEENKQLDDIRNANYLSWQDSVAIIKKAVEYIEKHRKVYKLGVNQETDEFDYISTSPRVLLNILRGEDK